LLLSSRLLSPAVAGTSGFDDGSTTTLLSLSRDPCPNSPLPMPMGYTLAFLFRLTPRARSPKSRARSNATAIDLLVRVNALTIHHLRE
jgi:hypothetical protein